MPSPPYKSTCIALRIYGNTYRWAFKQDVFNKLDIFSLNGIFKEMSKSKGHFILRNFFDCDGLKDKYEYPNF